MAENYKTVVIGRGLIGSAATRHLACIGEKVAVIGPAEPADKSLHQGVFGSHYDSGRITRILDPHPFYAAIAKKSIRRYRIWNDKAACLFMLKWVIWRFPTVPIIFVL